MRPWKACSFVVVVIILIIIAFSLIAQSDRELYIELVDPIIDLVINLFKNFMVIFYVFLSGAFAGFIWHRILLFIDSEVDVRINLTSAQTTIITFLVAILFGLLYTVSFRVVLRLPDTWILEIARKNYSGWEPWSGEFGPWPVLWSFYGFLTFLLGYYISPTILGSLWLRKSK